MEKEKCLGAMRTMSKRRISRKWNPGLIKIPHPREWSAHLFNGISEQLWLSDCCVSPLVSLSKYIVYCSYIVTVPPLCIGGLQIKKSNIQTSCTNYHLSPRVHALSACCHEWDNFFVFLPWVSVSVFCMQRRMIQILMTSRTGQTMLLIILAQLYLILLIIARQNFLVPLCFNEAM